MNLFDSSMIKDWNVEQFEFNPYRRFITSIGFTIFRTCFFWTYFQFSAVNFSLMQFLSVKLVSVQFSFSQFKRTGP